jgi:hypothetical protein
MKTVTPDQLRMGLRLAILLGDLLAPRTETKVDDLAVAKLKQLAANEAALALLAALLSGQTMAAPATPADRQLAEDVHRHAEASQLLAFALEQLK